MARRALPTLGVGAWFLLVTAPAAAADDRSPAAQLEFFEKKVRPVLADRCFSCHGSEKQKAGLRLDSRDAMMTGGDGGPVLVPGNPRDSLLVKAINYQAEPQMPPKGKLPAEQIAALTEWVRRGAAWPQYKEEGGRMKDEKKTASVHPSSFLLHPSDHWSFRPVADLPLPRVQDTTWPKTPVDYFVLAEQEAHGLHSAGPADRRTLIRRVTFDLLGLPPPPEEVEAFVHDPAPDAFAKVVDRLLASPHYGERWARHWLDVARYGEDQAHTFQARKYPNGFRYRDWLVKAFNADLPYDRFLKEQIAGDLLDGPNREERLAALGFFALGPVYYGDRKMLDQYDDRIDTLARGLLGLTVACARCHDHKFDPIPTKDYYALAGIFAGSQYEEYPLVPAGVVAEAKRKQTAAEKRNKVPPKYPFVHTLKEGKPTNLRVHVRGSPANLGDEVPRRFLTALGGRPLAKGSGRLELAECIAGKDNPLTARVLVNRVWQHHFGKGLVRTPSNFGALGERPTHPALLDHLAARFLASGWSIKALHREILLSATYQQNSRLDSHNYAVDADNKYLWRLNRRRLEVESWRDAMLAAADTLDRTLGGPSTDLAAADNRRRTFYGFVSRHELNPLLRLFDFPDPNITAAERTVTTVPLQQLFVLNSEFIVQNAKALAARLARIAPDDAGRIRAAFPLLYARPATEREVQMGLVFLSSAGSGAAGLTAWEQYAQVLLSANEFMYVD